MDYELLLLGIICMIAGSYFTQKNKFWTLKKDDLKIIPDVQLFFSGLIALFLGIITLIKVVMDLF